MAASTPVVNITSSIRLVLFYRPVGVTNKRVTITLYRMKGNSRPLGGFDDVILHHHHHQCYIDPRGEIKFQ